MHDVDETFAAVLLEQTMPYLLQRIAKPIEDVSRSDVAEAWSMPSTGVSCLLFGLAIKNLSFPLSWHSGCNSGRQALCFANTLVDLPDRKSKPL